MGDTSHARLDVSASCPARLDVMSDSCPQPCHFAMGQYPPLTSRMGHLTARPATNQGVLCSKEHSDKAVHSTYCTVLYCTGLREVGGWPRGPT